DSNPDRPSASTGGRTSGPPAKAQQAPQPQNSPQPMPRGQGTIEDGRTDAPPHTDVPAGRAGSGGHKQGYGR
ncbi:MAG TPA: hypothetical protein VEA17_07165, partial [Bordetella sp.]|nr:hypothetical protein [Bordetella sp.]